MSTSELALLVACFALGVELVAVGLVLLVVVKVRPALEAARPMLAMMAPTGGGTGAGSDEFLDSVAKFVDVDGDPIP